MEFKVKKTQEIAAGTKPVKVDKPKAGQPDTTIVPVYNLTFSDDKGTIVFHLNGLTEEEADSYKRGKEYILSV